MSKSILPLLMLMMTACTPQVIYVPYPAQQSAPSTPTPTPAPVAPQTTPEEEPAILARFMRYQEPDEDEILASLGVEPSQSLLFVHLLADTNEATFGPLAIMTFEQNRRGWSNVRDMQDVVGEDGVAQLLTLAGLEGSQESLGDSFVGMTDVTVVDDLQSLTWTVRYLEETGTTYNQLYWLTFGKETVTKTIFFVAEERAPLYRDDFSEFIQAVVAWTAEN